MDKQIRLGEVEGLEFIGGQITSRLEAKKNEDVEGSINVLTPKAINLGIINNDEVLSIDYIKKPQEARITKEGDIVIKLSSPYDAAYVTSEDEGLLVSSFCIIARNNGPVVTTDYLLTFFNSNVYRNQLLEMCTGAATPMATLSKIEDVMINILPKKEQQEVANYYKNTCKKQVLMEKIIGLEQEKIDVLLGGESK